MYDREWRVRESVIRVRAEDKEFQAQLENIGFHVLEDGYVADLVEASDGGPFLVMGRDELTRFHVLGTTLPRIEYCQGYVREREDSAGDARAPTEKRTDPHQDLPQRRVVADISGSFDTKKQKTI
jgi:hypothetical protein